MPAVSFNGCTATTGHLCSPTTGVLAAGNSKVFVGSALGLVAGDPTAPHAIKAGKVCIPHSASVNAGSSKVFFDSKPAARIGDSTDGGCLIRGNTKVFAG